MRQGKVILHPPVSPRAGATAAAVGPGSPVGGGLAAGGVMGEGAQSASADGTADGHLGDVDGARRSGEGGGADSVDVL